MDKVGKVDIGEGPYIYLISLEDIIIDKLRALYIGDQKKMGFGALNYLQITLKM